jgi:predicted RNase H-like HicB family nuclease
VLKKWEDMTFTLECEQEADGRWIAEVPELPGVLAYGSSSADAMAKAEILALRVFADRLENGESAGAIGRQPKPKRSWLRPKNTCKHRKTC